LGAFLCAFLLWMGNVDENTVCFVLYCLVYVNFYVIFFLCSQNCSGKAATELPDHSLQLDCCQSAYRAFHSTKTVVLEVISDILLTIDRGDLAALTLLDLSAAFDTVDPAILLHRLDVSYSLGGSVHCWFSSYLSGRTQYVSRPGLYRRLSYLASRRGQSSWDRSCSSYTRPHTTGGKSRPVPAHVCRWHSGLSVLSAAAQLQACISSCIVDVATWMTSNRLQLNTAKTQVIWCASTRQQHQLPTTLLAVGSDAVVPVRSVRDLGIHGAAIYTVYQALNNRWLSFQCCCIACIEQPPRCRHRSPCLFFEHFDDDDWKVNCSQDCSPLSDIDFRAALYFNVTHGLFPSVSHREGDLGVTTTTSLTFNLHLWILWP
jgi:hypothetical protein